MNNKQYNDSIKKKINDKICLSNKISAITRSETEIKNNRISSLQHETSYSGEYLGSPTASSKTSTGSEVNISDRDVILPSASSPTSTHLSSFAPPISSKEKNADVSLCPANKHISNDKNCKIFNNSNNNGDTDVDQGDENKWANSENFENKVNSYCAQNQPNEFDIESKNIINNSQQENFPTFTSNDKKSLQHNDFIKLRRSSVSTSLYSSLSMSSNSICCDDIPASKTQQYNGSPVVSIRSISSTIVTSDSDSEVVSDSENSHENYVIKKLGTQVTYSPNDPSIPKINSGHTVLNQKVIANDNQSPPQAALASLAAIGDSIGAAQALGRGPLTSGVPQRPQIGSIALNNSSDVTFGDKHFYEGPVTIQQFLIDSRDKLKGANGKENPSFVDENVESSINNAKDTNPAKEKSHKLYGCILKRKKLVIPGALAFMTLLIVASVLISTLLNDSKNANNNQDDDDHVCEGNGTLCLVERDGWRAHPQKNNLVKQVLPLHRVIISHTASEPCNSINICVERVRIIQEFHMNSLGWDDIAYNFLIGNDGRVYVGRGWDYVGSHTKGYNYDSVGVTFIGTYTSTAPTEVQLEVCLSLLQEGLRLQKLTSDYRLYGARQLGSTESPGDMLYNRIQKWEHWSADINPQDNIGGGYVLRIVPRGSWLAQPPVNPLVHLNLPVGRVIVIPTRTAECETQASCTYTVRITQTYNIESQQQDDIIYNFLIGGDGNVYEGRGWDKRGSVVKGFNDDSVSFAYIGSFKKQSPSYKQLNVTKLLLEEGVNLKKLSSNYKILGANTLDPTSVATIADALYTSFKNWPHWSDE